MTDPADYNSDSRDYKPLLLISVSLLLIVLSIVLLSRWVFDSKPENTGKKEKKVMVENDEPNLPADYDSAVHYLDSTLNAAIRKTDSLEKLLNIKIEDIAKLQEEVKTILNTPGKRANLPKAKEKIKELGKKVNEITADNSAISTKKRRRNSEKTIPNAPTSAEAVFSMKELSISAIYTEGGTPYETKDAEQEEKISGFFTIQSGSNPPPATEIIIVLIGPNGQTINAGWESGNFSTTGGMKPYTCKLAFDCAPLETKKVSFSIMPESLPPGRYTAEAYYQGKLAGRCNTRLY